MDVSIRPLGPEDRAAGYGLRVDAFTTSGTASYDDAEPYVPDDRRLGAFAGDRMVGHVAAWRLGQWFLGRRVPMAGLAGVAIQPDHGGRGVAGRLITETLQRCLDQGDAISTLDAAAPSLYRRLGWAYAGAWFNRTVPTAALRGLPTPPASITCRPLRWDADLPAFAAIWRAEATRGHGRVDRDDVFMRRLTEPDDGDRLWVAERDGRVVGGAVLHRVEPGPGDRSVMTLVVESLVAEDHDGWLALWRTVGSQASQSARTRYRTGPHDPLMDLLDLPLHEQRCEVNEWMTRVLDAPAAVSSRGWPAGVDAEVPLRLVDEVLPGHAGEWVLRVGGGTGRLERGGAGRVVLDVGALSALFTGHVGPGALAWQGRLGAATTADVNALAAAFASPQPYMIDHY